MTRRPVKISRSAPGGIAQSAAGTRPRQVADRFHLLQNLREAIEAQLSPRSPPDRLRLAATRER